MQFAAVDTGAELADNTIFGFEKNRLLQTAEIFAIIIAIILVLLLVIQPMVGKLLVVEKEKQDTDGELEKALLAGGDIKPALMGPDGQFEPAMLEEADNDNDDEMIDVESIQGKVKASSVKKVEDIIENYPAETVSVIRSWMTED